MPLTMQDQRELIGAYLLNFGAAEMATFQWITVLSSDHIVKDMAIDMPLTKRVSLICKLLERSNLPIETKQIALRLWGQIPRLALTRNKIAHSPLAENPDGSGWCIIDVKQMKGKGPYSIEPLNFDRIASEGSEAAKVIRSLLELITEISRQREASTNLENSTP